MLRDDINGVAEATNGQQCETEIAQAARRCVWVLFNLRQRKDPDTDQHRV